MTVPDLLLEQYRLGELPADVSRQISLQLAIDPALQDRLAALDRSDREIARTFPSTRMSARARETLNAGHRPPPWWRIPIAVGAMLVVVLAIGQRLNVAPDANVPPPETDRLKGLQPSLTIYRRTGNSSETLADGSVARAGDVLRVGYNAAGRAYGVILSIDGLGVITRHLPVNGDRAAALNRQGLALLDEAYELDDAPGSERFYFITGDTPFAIAPVVKVALDAAAGGTRPPPSLPIPSELTQSSVSVQKEVRQ